MTRGDDPPENCDCCGHDAEDCGMLDAGWVDDAQLLPGGATYCWSCAHLLRIVRLAEQCAWCEAPLAEEETAEAEGWGYYADSLGDLYPCCPRCLAERFEITGRVRLRRSL